MNKKQQAYIDSWKAKWDVLESKLRSKIADAKLGVIRKKEELDAEAEFKARRAAWKAKLDELHSASDEKWESFKDSVESAWRDMENSFNRWHSKHQS